MTNPLVKFAGLFSHIKEADNIKPIFANYLNTFQGRSYSKRDWYYGIVFSCIDAIATNVSTNDFDLYTTDKKGNKKEVDDHPAYKLLQTPNPYQTGVDLLYLLSSHIDTAGKAYLYPVPNAKGEPVELWALDPTRIVTVPAEGKFIGGYIYITEKSQKVPFDVTELIPISRPNPFDQKAGISTIEMARRSIESDLNSQDFNTNFFQNGASPSGILTTDVPINEDTFQRVKEQWHDKYEGNKNAHKTLILDAGLKYQQVQISQRDMDFVKGRQLSRDEILSIFKVPKTIVAITDDVNRANAETSDYTFAKRTVKPRLQLIFEKLNRFYLPKFKNTAGLEFEYENPVPDDQALELQYDQAAVNTWETVNEIRDRHGLEPLVGGDVLNPVSATDIVTPQNTPTEGKMITKSAHDRQYINSKKRAKSIMTKDFQLRVKQHFNFLVREVDGKKNKKSWSGWKKGVEDTMSELLPDMTEWAGIMAELTFDQNLEALKSSIKLTSTYYNLPTEFNLENSGVIAILRSRANTTADGVRNTILERARKIIASSLEQDQTNLNDIKDNLVSVLKDESVANAERIARTEMSYAFNEGAMQDMKSSGLITSVKWILGDNACEICKANDDQVVGLNESFNTGDFQPPVHPNCECDIVPYFD